VIASVDQSGPLKKWLFYTAYEAKVKAIKEGRETPIWDKLVFSKVNERILGGRVETIISGSAPLSPKVQEFLRVCFTPVVCEGYGLTETSAGVCISYKESRTTGNVGPVIPSAEIKLVDVPEMSYYSTDSPCPRGELCVKGPSVSQGYYKNPEKNC